jgi:hypothetical protein
MAMTPQEANAKGLAWVDPNNPNPNPNPTPAPTPPPAE